VSEDRIRVSAVLSIHNRGALLGRALSGYLWQTMPPEQWEIILVDDMSTEDLHRVYQPHLGRMNIRHVRIDHTRHPAFGRRNPGWAGGDAFQNWYHTPAISINVGVALARGAVVCLCHPEILHAPANFERAAGILAASKLFVFGQTYLGTQEMNRTLDAMGEGWTAPGWDGFLRKMGGDAVPRFRSNELYWYTSFLPRAAATAVGGVDFEFLGGASGEDDDFKDRVGLEGYPAKLFTSIEGFHQDHSHEGEAHRRRDTAHWERGLKHNRAILHARRGGSAPHPRPANQDCDWTARQCIVEDVCYSVGGRLLVGPP
jgi:glycosyltransferase involved in cell wall biosynthesis